MSSHRRKISLLSSCCRNVEPSLQNSTGPGTYTDHHSLNKSARPGHDSELHAEMNNWSTSVQVDGSLNVRSKYDSDVIQGRNDVTSRYSKDDVSDEISWLSAETSCDVTRGRISRVDDVTHAKYHRTSGRTKLSVNDSVLRKSRNARQDDSSNVKTLHDQHRSGRDFSRQHTSSKRRRNATENLRRTTGRYFGDSQDAAVVVADRLGVDTSRNEATSQRRYKYSSLARCKSINSYTSKQLNDDDDEIHRKVYVVDCDVIETSQKQDATDVRSAYDVTRICKSDMPGGIGVNDVTKLRHQEPRRTQCISKEAGPRSTSVPGITYNGETELHRTSRGKPGSTLDQPSLVEAARDVLDPHRRVRSAVDDSVTQSSLEASLYAELSLALSQDSTSLSCSASRSSWKSSHTSVSIFTELIVLDLTQLAHLYLGLSLLGQRSRDCARDRGIYVSDVKPGGIVDRDGRINVGDVILEVNDIDLEPMSNEQALRTIRTEFHRAGLLSLVIGRYYVDSASVLNAVMTSQQPDHHVTVREAWQGRGRDSYVTEAWEGSGRGPHNSSTTFVGIELVDWVQRNIEGMSEMEAAVGYVRGLHRQGYISPVDEEGYRMEMSSFSQLDWFAFTNDKDDIARQLRTSQEMRDGLKVIAIC